MSDPDGGQRTPWDDDREEADRRHRVVAQFSDAGDRAAIWRGFDRFLPTTEYLNLGYSPWYLPIVIGDSQARLARMVADGLAARVDEPDGRRLLDIGCGRGGPARQFAARGFVVTGVDLVPYNVALARANARRTDDGGDDARTPAFLVGDAAALPFPDGTFAAATAVDALVYLPDERSAFGEVARVLEPDGRFATADLLARDDDRPGADEALDAFAEAWDLAPIVAAGTYRRRLREAGFEIGTVEDVTANSTGRFRKWARAFLALADGPTGGALRRLLARWDVDPEVAIAQVRAAHRALPHLRHEVVYARARSR